MAGLYVHFPFCASKCIYCDFYSRVGKEWTPYTEALLREISDRREELEGVLPTTLYFGGGTPSLLPAARLARVAEAVRKSFGTGTFKEFTVEVNPDDVTPGKAAALRAAGVNRISMGVQSFSDAHLRWMGRRHTAADAVTAFDRLRGAGFDNLSLDLIFGFTGLSDADWQESIERALALQPEHVSCYQMMGRWSDPDEDRCRHQYTMLQERLETAGIRQYEVSNYARPGFESLHNSAYWAREPYIGFGAGAHSFDGRRRRSWNTPDMDAYITRRSGGEELLSDREILEEKLMLSLRTVRGLDLSRLSPAERECIQTALEKHSRAGFLIWSYEQQTVRIPRRELFILDWIVEALFPD